jgi:predicted metal-binding membrane protein
MVMLAALGLMSLLWMSVVAVLVTAQKFLPVKAVVDVSLALAIVALGVLIVVAPATVPGLTPAM